MTGSDGKECGNLSGIGPSNVPIILRYPNSASSPQRLPGDADRTHAAIQRFVFPELRDAPDAPTSGPAVLWPKSNDIGIARACAVTADNILGQWSFDRPAVFGFTSPSDGDGKTRLVIGLAPQMARRAIGNVLVVDANFHKPDLTAELGLLHTTKQTSPQICTTNLPRLSILASNGPQDPRRFAKDHAWLNSLRAGRQLVLLDMASLVWQETLDMAERCDGVYLIVRLGYTTRRAITDSVCAIEACGGRLLGTIVIG